MIAAVSRSGLLTITGFGVLAMIGGAWMLMRDSQLQERLSLRVRQIHGEAVVSSTSMEQEQFKAVLASTVAGIGQMVLDSGLVPAATRTQLETMLRGAGIRSPHAVGVFFGAKMAAMILCPIFAWLMTRSWDLSTIVRLFIPMAAAVAGMLLPDMIVKRVQARFTAKLLRGLPDALDMMVICAQAGLALGPTVVRVADEMRYSYRELASEFALTANELQIMSDAKIALYNFGHRTGIDAFMRLSRALTQTIQYGTPLSEALRALSAEMRQEALTAFEEAAARLPTLLTLPMILFILPCVFMIGGGPAMIQLAHAMK